MERPWQAEREVGPELARGLIEAQFPEFVGAPIEPFGVGWDNTAYLVDGHVVFRFPRRQIAVPLIRTEIVVLNALAPRLPLAIPRPTWVGAPGPDYPWPFAGYERLPGTTACRAALDHEGRVRAAEPLATFLRALHDIAPSEARSWGAGGDTRARTDVQKRAAQARELLARVRGKGLLVGTTWPEALLEAGLTAQPEARELTTLVHGDLYARHLLVDDAGALCGVIDWGDVHVGHPGLDLSVAYAFLPPAGRERFFAAYGPIEERVAHFARFRALFSLLAILIYGDDTNDHPLLQEAQSALPHLPP